MFWFFPNFHNNFDQILQGSDVLENLCQFANAMIRSISVWGPGNNYFNSFAVEHKNLIAVYLKPLFKCFVRHEYYSHGCCKYFDEHLHDVKSNCHFIKSNPFRVNNTMYIYWLEYFLIMSFTPSTLFDYIKIPFIICSISSIRSFYWFHIEQNVYEGNVVCKVHILEDGAKVNDGWQAEHHLILESI